MILELKNFFGVSSESSLVNIPMTYFILLSLHPCNGFTIHMLQHIRNCLHYDYYYCLLSQCLPCSNRP